MGFRLLDTGASRCNTSRIFTLDICGGRRDHRSRMVKISMYYNPTSTFRYR